jgi:hypothetical protein
VFKFNSLYFRKIKVLRLFLLTLENKLTDLLNLTIQKIKGTVTVLNYQITRHKDVWGSEGIAPPFLISALDVSRDATPCNPLKVNRHVPLKCQ